jgi:DNA-directed RNA polymerase I, II, and III subunit RPABC2
MEYSKNISSKKDNINSLEDQDDDNAESEIDDAELDPEDNDNDNVVDSDNDDDDDSDIEYDSDNPDNSISRTNADNIESNGEKTISNLLQTDISQQYDDVDYESSDDDDDNLKKLDFSRPKLKTTHNNLQSINYIEVEKLSKIVRDENNMIIDVYHTTVPILSKYEKTKVLGLRTKQINHGSKPFIPVDEEVIDGYIIAERELMQKKIPFIIKRPISNDKFEYWRLEDLEIV